MNANQWKRALFSHSEGEKYKDKAPAQNILSSTMRGSGKRIGGIEAIKVGMDETGVSGFFCLSSF